MRSPCRLYKTDNGRIVTENDPNGRVLFAKVGDEIPDYLVVNGQKMAPEPENKMMAPPNYKSERVKIIRKKKGD